MEKAKDMSQKTMAKAKSHPLITLIFLGVLGYLGYRWWQERQAQKEGMAPMGIQEGTGFMAATPTQGTVPGAHPPTCGCQNCHRHCEARCQQQHGGDHLALNHAFHQDCVRMCGENQGRCQGECAHNQHQPYSSPVDQY